jgi:hypothetical protein
MQGAHLVVSPGRGRGFLGGQERLVTVGGDGSERDGVHPDAARPVVHGQRAGQAFDRGLSGGVLQRSADRSLGLVRGNVDDGAANNALP